jgi:hypothetical protein
MILSTAVQVILSGTPERPWPVTLMWNNKIVVRHRRAGAGVHVPRVPGGGGTRNEEDQMTDETRADRLPELIDYVRGDLARRDAAGDQHVHVHYHQAPAPTGPIEPTRPAGMAALDCYVPYFLMLLGGMIIVAGVGALAIMLLSALVSIMISLAICAGAVAVLAVAVGGSVKAIQNGQHDKALTRAALRKRR